MGYSKKQEIKSSLIEDFSEEKISKIDQEIISTDIKDSSLVSVESGVVTGDDRESSLEIEQVEKMRTKPQRKEIDALSDTSGSSEKRKSPRGLGRQSPRSIGRQSPRSIGRQSPRSLGRPTSSERIKKYRKPKVSSRIDIGRSEKTEEKSKVDDEDKAVKTERKTKKERSLERKERKIRSTASETVKEDAEKDKIVEKKKGGQKRL